VETKISHIERDHTEAQPQIFGEAALREQLSMLDELSLYEEGLREESNGWEHWRLKENKKRESSELN
jgi:hypothetical protein